MKVLHIAGSISRRAGGLFNSVRRLAQEQVRLGCAVEILGGRDEYSELDAGEWAPLNPRIYEVRGPDAFGYSAGIKAELDEWRPDVVHLHGLWQYPSLAAGNWVLANGAKYVVSPRGMLDAWALRNSLWKKKIAGVLYEKRNLNRADCVHALTEKEANDIRVYGVDSEICVVPNGVDGPEGRFQVAGSRLNGGGEAAEVEGSRLNGEMEGGKGQGSEFMGQGEHRKILLYIGRLHPKKGLESLLQAWALARKQLKDAAQWRLIIAGWDDGGLERKLRSMVAELGIESGVSFTGPVYGDVKDELLRKADAFILPSLSEGLPMSVLEAWAYGLPVIMTRECNLSSGFEAGAAIEIEPDRDGVLRGLTRLASMSEEDIIAMGGRGRKLVADKYSWREIAERMIAVYERIISG